MDEVEEGEEGEEDDGDDYEDSIGKSGKREKLSTGQKLDNLANNQRRRKQFQTISSNTKNEFNYEQESKSQVVDSRTIVVPLGMTNMVERNQEENKLTETTAAASLAIETYGHHRTTNYEQLGSSSASLLNNTNNSFSGFEIITTTTASSNLVRKQPQEEIATTRSIWPIRLFGSGSGSGGMSGNELSAYQASATYPASAIIHWTLLIGSLLSLILFVLLLLRKLFATTNRCKLLGKSSSSSSSSSYKWMLARQQTCDSNAAAANIRKGKVASGKKMNDLLLKQTIAIDQQQHFPISYYHQRLLQRPNLSGCGAHEENECSQQQQQQLNSSLTAQPFDFAAAGPAAGKSSNSPVLMQQTPAYKLPPHHRKFFETSKRLMVDLNGNHHMILGSNDQDEAATAHLIHHSPATKSSSNLICTRSPASSNSSSSRHMQALDAFYAGAESSKVQPVNCQLNYMVNTNELFNFENNNNNYDVPNHDEIGDDYSKQNNELIEMNGKSFTSPRQTPLSAASSPSTNSGNATSLPSSSASSSGSHISIQSTTVQMLSSSLEKSPELVDESCSPSLSNAREKCVITARDPSSRRKQFKSLSSSARKRLHDSENNNSANSVIVQKKNDEHEDNDNVAESRHLYEEINS